MSEGDFLSRWSRRKIEARRGLAEAEGRAPATAAAALVPAAPSIVPAEAGTQPPAQAATQSPAPAERTAQPLPALESLTTESDFAPFMRPDVDAGVRRTALKTLFDDPRFNVMDGLDVYIDDYSKPDPLPEGWLEKLNQVSHLGHYQAPVEEAAVPPVAVEGSPPEAVPAPGPEPAVEVVPVEHPDTAAKESAQAPPEGVSGV